MDKLTKSPGQLLEGCAITSAVQFRGRRISAAVPVRTQFKKEARCATGMNFDGQEVSFSPPLVLNAPVGSRADFWLGDSHPLLPSFDIEEICQSNGFFQRFISGRPRPVPVPTARKR